MPNHKRILAKSKRSFLNVVKKHPILVSIFCIALVGIMSTFIYRYYEQQKTLNDLQAVSKELRVIYQNILEENMGDVSVSYFRNECSFAYVGPYSKSISCGLGADIALNKDISTRVAGQVIRSAINDSKLNPGSDVDIEERTASIDLNPGQNGVRCYIAYGKDTSNNSWGYHLSCRRSVPDFLPGYVVKE